VIAEKQHCRALERERHMVGGVARRRHRFVPPTRTADGFTVSERNVGVKVAIGGSFQWRRRRCPNAISPPPPRSDSGRRSGLDPRIPNHMMRIYKVEMHKVEPR
jgi:hypothetical protein